MSDDLKLTPEQRAAYIRNMFESSELDPASTQLTLNHAYERATPEALLAASQKIIKLSRGEARADNRDSLAFQTVHGTEDFLADKIRNDQNRILQNNLWKATNRGSIDRIPSGILDAHTNHMLTDSGLGFVLEEINPLEILDQSHKVTRMGEGALPSLDSVPDSARNVQPSYAGFVDLVRSPESLKVGVDLNLARNVRKGPDNLLYTQFLDIATGKSKWVSHQEAATSIIGSSDDYDPAAAFVPAIAGMDGIQYVPRESVKYLIRSGDDLFSELAGTVPLKSGVKGMRLLMGCLAGDTIIHVCQRGGPLKSMPIEKYYRRRRRSGDLVLSIDEATGELIWVEVQGVKRNTEEHPMLRITLQSGRAATTTDNHKWVIRGSSRLQETYAADLKVGDLVPCSDPTRTPFQAPGELCWEPITSIEPAGTSAMTYDLDVNDRVFMVNEGIFVHNSKFIKSAVPLVNREAALVQSEDAHGNSLFKSLASRVGAQFADQDGIVEAVTDNSIKIRYADGTLEDKELYVNHPYSRKTFLHNTPQVTPGQAVKQGDILASSNFTDDKGTLALGVNLRTGYSSAHGKVFEDSIVISESAAKKLASQHMYHEDVEEDAEVKYDKRRFMMSFPGKFTKEQLAKLDDNGVVKPGQTLETGDPVYVGVRQLQPGPGRLIKNRLAPEIVRWEHKHPGTVTDIGKTKKGYSAYIQSISPMEPGDKLMLPYGGKGVVSEIIPDEQMFKDAEGNTLDMLMSPLGVISRTNSAQLAAASLAKIASKTGKPYVLPGFMDENMTQFAISELEKHGLTDREDLTDPTNGRTIPQVFVGVHHVYKGSQMAESKGKSRGIAGYTMDDQPSKGGADGAKHMGCFPGYQRILTPYGEQRISEIVEKRLREHVWSLDHTTGEWAFRPVSNWFTYQATEDDLLTIELTYASTAAATAQQPGFALLHPTRQHMIYRFGGEKVRADELKVGDQVISWDQQTTDEDGIRKTIPAVVTAIRPYKHPKGVKTFPVYDITVEDVHNYTVDGICVSNSMELRGLLSHGAFDVLKDMKMIKGQRTDDFWRKLKLGQTPVMPGTPTTYTKFKEMIKAAGVNLVEENDAVRIFGMTDSQAEKLTGNRKLESAGTFNQQNFKPIASGLFDPEATDSMGAGNRWAYYALPEPVLNPIMSEPVRRILGLTNAQMDAVMNGEQKIGNGYGGKALKEHLDSLDLSKVIDSARQTLRTGSKSVRDDAVKTLAYAVAMQREGVKPSEFMMTRVPVLPPAFRPITQMSGRTMVADPNYMYLNLKNAIDDFEDAKILPPELQNEARKTMAQSYKALVGLVDPEQEKLQSKNVGGILQSILGKSSPKLGYVQRRVIGTNIDMAGLGVATLNPNLKLNEVGLPMEEAWKLYEPFVVRGLVQQGLPAMQAAEAVASRSPKAFTVLKGVVEERPVIVNRAPTLHRYGMMALWPKLVKGHAIQMAPGIHSPYNLDHDGNCVDFHSEISVRIPMSTLDKFLASIYSCDVVSSTSQGDLSMRVTSETAVQVTADNHFGYITMPIGKFPRAGVPKKDLNGADTYDVSGFNASVLSYDIQTGKASYEPITAFTVEQDCECRDVKLQTRQVIVSSNESLSVFDPETGDLVKTKPDDAIGKLCPVIKQDPSPFGQLWGRDFGWMLGMFVSDGWLSENYVGLSKTEACKRQEFIRIAREQLDPELLVREYADKKGVNKYGDSCKAHLYGDTLHRRIFELDTTTINPEGKRQAITKRLPARFLQQGSEEFLWGLLSGMVDGDGGFVKNTALENPRYSVRFNTSSEDLRDGCIALCYRLGLRCSVTDKDAFATSKISYVMHISTVDIYPHLDKLTCVGNRETAIKSEWQLAGPPSEIGASAGIPISHAEAKALCALARMQTPPDNSAYTACHKVIKGKQGRIMRSTVAKLLATPGAPELPALRARLNPDIVWEQVNESKEVEPREVFDFEVPTTKVFAVNNGLVVYDTLSYSVPVSKSAVDQAKNTMMPQHHLLSTQDDSPHYAPGQDYLMGMYLASKEPANVPAKRFATWQDAERAYRKGEIDIDTPVVVQ